MQNVSRNDEYQFMRVQQSSTMGYWIRRRFQNLWARSSSSSTLIQLSRLPLFSIAIYRSCSSSSFEKFCFFNDFHYLVSHFSFISSTSERVLIFLNRIYATTCLIRTRIGSKLFSPSLVFILFASTFLDTS